MAVVYPHITIKDTEEASLLQFDATDNTVLVPIPFAKRFYIDPDDQQVWDPDESEGVIQAELYLDAAKFVSDWSTGAGEWEVEPDEEGNMVWKEAKDKTPRYCFDYSIKFDSINQGGKYKYDVIYSPEKSYLMALELIKMGLPVLVRPIPVEYDNSVVDSDGQIVVDQGELPNVGGTKDVVFDTTEKIVFGKHGAFARELERLIASPDGIYSISDDPNAFRTASNLCDKNIYPIKFVTSGAYPNIGEITTDGDFSEMYGSMARLAKYRGDAIALIELREDIYNKEDLLNVLENNFPDLSSNFELYKMSAAFTPWCEFTIGKSLPLRVREMTNIEKREKSARKYNVAPLTTMPACFAYLMAYAYSIQTNETWFAAAGVTRGQIPQMVKPLFEIGESLMHILQGKDANQNISYQRIRLNPIMNTGSYGYRIWGNRVAGAFKDLAGVYKSMFTEFLNVRMLLCDIKKQIYVICGQWTGIAKMKILKDTP